MGAAFAPRPAALRALAEVWLTAALVLCAALLGSLGGLGRIDQTLYDRVLSLVGRPPPQDVLIVAIDDRSIAELGHWPWRRAVHAQMLDRLGPARAVGLDIMFAEPDTVHSGDDLQLADAIRRHGRVVLPEVLEQGRRTLAPIAPLAAAARASGFINIEPDADGVVRRVSLARHADDALAMHFSLAMMRAGADEAPVDRALARAAGQRPPLLIPYAGGPGHFTTVSYLDVLQGRISPGEIADKYVLVGAWATGLGDVFPTPVSHHSSGMSGVEIIANTLHAARLDTMLAQASPWLGALGSALPVLLLCLMLPRLSPKQALVASAAMLLCAFAGSTLLLRVAHVWLPPFAALLMLTLCYPIWSWRSQEAALRYMNNELRRLEREYPPVLSEARAQAPRASRSLESRVSELRRALARVRNLRRFLADGLNGMPDATMVFDREGLLRFHNRAAALHFRRLGMRRALIGQHAARLLAGTVTDEASRQAVANALREPAAHGASPWSADLEMRDQAGRDLILKCAPIHTAEGGFAGTVVTLSDISAIRAAERQREETMRFISHDMRAPQNSILALVELHRDGATPEQLDTLERISQLAMRTLNLVDAFVHLSSAESVAITPRPLDLADLLQDAVDELWAQADLRGIAIAYEAPAQAALTQGDAALLLRALRNLVDNAIKYSPDGSRVSCAIAAAGDEWEIRIADEGPGIPPEDRERIFMPFTRLNSEVRGTGLGLPFVRIVVERHHGRIGVTEAPERGSCFVVRLPRFAEDAAG